MQQPLIQVHDLTRRDAKTGRVLLDRVNLQIRAGERIGLVGPSGSGKSILLRAIVRLDRCDGEVRYHGQLVEKDALPGYRRQVIYLTQRPAFVAGTVRMNLQLPFALNAAERAFDEALATGWLQQLRKPASFLDQPTDALSGGEQQIVALVRALSLNPQVLLLDEPTASLDPAATARFEELIEAWLGEPGDTGNENSPARALLWTSHDAQQLSRMTNRTLFIRGGAVGNGESDA